MKDRVLQVWRDYRAWVEYGIAGMYLMIAVIVFAYDGQPVAGSLWFAGAVLFASMEPTRRWWRRRLERRYPQHWFISAARKHGKMAFPTQVTPPPPPQSAQPQVPLSGMYVSAAASAARSAQALRQLAQLATYWYGSPVRRDNIVQAWATPSDHGNDWMGPNTEAAWSATPIIGWRTWTENHGYLVGQAGTNWTSTRHTAECLDRNQFVVGEEARLAWDRGAAAHPIPHMTMACNECGIYAFRDPAVFGAVGTLGLVALSGRVIEGSKGWRAEQAEVIAVVRHQVMFTGRVLELLFTETPAVTEALLGGAQELLVADLEPGSEFTEEVATEAVPLRPPEYQPVPVNVTPAQMLRMFGIHWLVDRGHAEGPREADRMFPGRRS